MIQGVTCFHFETGCEGHRFYVWPDEAVKIQDVCGRCGKYNHGSSSPPDIEFLREHLNREPNECELEGEHKWTDQRWCINREPTFELKDGDYIRIYDKDGKEVLYEDTMSFRDQPYDYPEDYRYGLSIRYIPEVDMDFTEFVDLFQGRHPCEVERHIENR